VLLAVAAVLIAIFAFLAIWARVAGVRLNILLIAIFAFLAIRERFALVLDILYYKLIIYTTTKCLN
jgi:hypothetical protein